MLMTKCYGDTFKYANEMALLFNIIVTKKFG